MTSIIKYTLKELESLIESDKSCVSKKTVIQNIAFQPWCLANLKDSLHKIMNNKIGKFDKQLNGIILSYKNILILDDVYAIHKDNSELFSDVQADFYVFQPHVGATLHGVISKKSMTHLGVLVHKVFNVVIPTPSNQSAESWIGSKLNVGQEVTFKVVVLDLFGALPYIRGAFDESSLPPVSDDVDSKLDDEVENFSSTHVNFDGIKPKFIKREVKAENGVGENQIKMLVEKTERAVPCDSDLVSDVDDVYLKQQDKIMKKALLSDKKKSNSKNRQVLTPSTPGLKKLHDNLKKGIKDHDGSSDPRKEINDSIIIRKKKISLDSSKIDIVHLSKSSPDCDKNNASNISLTSRKRKVSLDSSKIDIANSSNNSPDSVNNISMKARKSKSSLDNLDTLSKSSPDSVNNNISLKSKKGKSSLDPSKVDVVESSKSSPDSVISLKSKKSKSSFDTSKIDVDNSSETPPNSLNTSLKSKKSKSCLDTSKIDVDSLKNSPDSVNNISLKSKKSKSSLDTSKIDVVESSSDSLKSKKERKSIDASQTDSLNNISMISPSILEDTSFKSNKKKKKKHSHENNSAIPLDISDSEININNSLDTSRENKKHRQKEMKKLLKNEGINQSNSPKGLTKSTSSHTVKEKRKRKFSETFEDEDCWSSETPARKRKKDKSYVEDSDISNNTQDISSLSDSTTSNLESKKVKKKRKKTDGEERDEAADKSNSEDTVDRLKKVQDLLLQIASDPTLLTDIQTLIDKRRSK